MGKLIDSVYGSDLGEAKPINRWKDHLKAAFAVVIVVIMAVLVGFVALNLSSNLV